jgi:hypothetical protein
VPVKANIQIEATDYSPILKRKQTEIVDKNELAISLKPIIEEPSPQLKPEKKP